MSRAAVVVNPTKLDDDEAFRKSVRRVMDDHGWDEPLWLETTPEDPGRGQAESAVSAGVGLVLACGGDGTVTACAEGITGTGVPLAIIPMGTGNLLARNIGLPMGLEEALAVALGGVQQPIDAGRVNGALFVVMAGLGLDAEMLSGTSEPLKKRLGWFAYAISAVRHLGDRPMRVTVRADGSRRRRMRANALIVGNVGWLRGGLPLLPDARPDDGMLDAVVLTAAGLTGWLAVTAGVLLRRPAHGRIYRVQFTELQVTLDQDQPWELDGEVMSPARQLTVVQGSVTQLPLAEQHDPPFLQLLGVPAQPDAYRRQRQLHEYSQRDGFDPLHPRRRQDVEPGVHHQQRGRRGGRRGQITRPAEREIGRAGQRQHQQHVEAGPGSVIVSGHLPGGQ